MPPFENDNIRAYTLLLRIEVVLRESLKQSMACEHGVHWQKRLPGDLLAKIRKSQSDESKPQFGFVRLGPLYYLTFGELLTLLQQKSGRTVADKFGGDCFLKQLENLFSPRNALCHSRPVSPVGVKTLETIYVQMEAALTKEVMACILETPDTGIGQLQAANALNISLNHALLDIPSLPTELPSSEVYSSARAQYWWASDILAGFNRSIIEAAFDGIGEYNSLPKGVGSAYKRQRFSEQHDLPKLLRSAVSELDNIVL